MCKSDDLSGPVGPVPHVTSFIQEELDERGWSRADLANKMGFETCVRNMLVLDLLFELGPDTPSMDFTVDISEQIANAFGVEARFLRNLDYAWRREQERPER